MGIEIITSKTKSGKAVQVAVIPAEMVGTLERMHWDATAIAREKSCAHYRVVDQTGRVISHGKAGALPTQEQTARTTGDGSDWSRD